MSSREKSGRAETEKGDGIRGSTKPSSLFTLKWAKKKKLKQSLNAASQLQTLCMRVFPLGCEPIHTSDSVYSSWGSCVVCVTLNDTEREGERERADSRLVGKISRATDLVCSAERPNTTGWISARREPERGTAASHTKRSVIPPHHHQQFHVCCWCARLFFWLLFSVFKKEIEAVLCHLVQIFHFKCVCLFLVNSNFIQCFDTACKAVVREQTGKA